MRVWVWITGRTEGERRRNGNFRGGEVVLTLTCCQAQGVESEGGMKKKEREIVFGGFAFCRMLLFLPHQ